MPTETAPSSATFDLQIGGGGRATLVLHGSLDAKSTPVLWQQLEQRLPQARITTLEIDARGVTYCNGVGMALLHYLIHRGMSESDVTLRGLKPEFARQLHSFSPEDYAALRCQPEVTSSVPEEIGETLWQKASDFHAKVGFLGDTLSALARTLFLPRMMQWREVLRLVEVGGVNALPLVFLISFLVGLVVAFESAPPLAHYGAQLYIADIIGLVMIKEFGPIMTAILLAGRSGSAFAAELGTMKVNEELDALETMGLDPMQFLVVQRVVACTILNPLLTLYAMFAGVLGGVVVMRILGFPFAAIYNELVASVGIGDVVEGASKGVVFGILVGIISCLRGMQTGEGPAAVGASATRAVVSGIVFIIVTDAVIAALVYVLQE